MNNQWLNNLRRKMEDHTEDTPDGLWEDIRDELFGNQEENKVIGFNPESKNPEEDLKNPRGGYRPVWYRIAGAAAAVALFFLIGNRLFERYGNGNSSLQSQARSENNSKIKNPDNFPNNELFQNEKENMSMRYSSGKKDHSGMMISDATSTENIFTQIIDKVNNIIKIDNSSETGIHQNIDKTADLGDNQPGIQENKSIADPDHPAEGENTEHLSQNEKEREDTHEVHQKLASAKKKTNPSWMLSLLTGNASSNSAEQFPGYATINGSPMSIDEVFHTSGYGENPLTEVLLANQEEEVKATVKHKVPVTFGVSLYRNLGKRWGIGTGVNYTKLSSELRSGSTTSLIKTDQSVHYIGIPIQVNYNVVQKGKFTGYITGGALVEKAVAGSVKTQYIVNDEIKEEKKEKLESKPVQFSVNTAAGVQYKIIKNVGVYAEPGVGYHFRDNSSLNTLYKDKPLNFNMKFGIRLVID
ncbi:hypothetical protein HNP38_002122 [Chryseobacterium defluvii]|uniref:Outer membrane protein beta-barrel domain-containing protein n=1 Tax=Chryseobacterium defluvii TaxID=160396 RepID=A0A840KCA6_9FLAO|nr:outer membrane beta-barrel protein [Chryseobacterium defluvii]MBB4806826.1 hypothetical protein [Chryseobacterium defluvii]